MASVIEQAKLIPASTIAEQQGVILKRQGERQGACCPLHSDQRPSLCFYPDGSWHCFSCGAGGDSVALLAGMLGISQLEAARDAVRRAGLNQRSEICREWFRDDRERWDMFSRRLAELKKI